MTIGTGIRSDDHCGTGSVAGIHNTEISIVVVHVTMVCQCMCVQ